MFNFIRKTLNGSQQQSGPDTDDGRVERTRIAASVILLEAAQADYECTEAEIDHIIETLRTDFDLSQQHAEELVDLARRERGGSVDLFEFTSHINDEFSKDEKKTVLQSVWRIILLDGLLEKHEEHFVRKLTYLLRLSNKDMIDAKLRAREQLQ